MTSISCASLTRSERSKVKDPSTQTGAILVNPQNIILAFGYNHLPWEMNDNQEIWNDREQKYQSVIHAEVDVISVAESYLEKKSPILSY